MVLFVFTVSVFIWAVGRTPLESSISSLTSALESIFSLRDNLFFGVVFSFHSRSESKMKKDRIGKNRPIMNHVLKDLP